MTARYLNEYEIKVLRGLEDGRWRTPTELAAETSVHVQNVRAALRHLAGDYHLVERGGWGASTRWGEWRIKPAGAAELAGRAQIELPL